MRTTRSGYFSSYWSLALVAALIAMAALQAYRGGAAAHEPLAADKVTAELARAVSYGIIDADTSGTASAVRRAAAPVAAPVASST